MTSQMFIDFMTPFPSLMLQWLLTYIFTKMSMKGYFFLDFVKLPYKDIGRSLLHFGNITLNGAPPTPSLHSQYSWQQVNTATYYI